MDMEFGLTIVAAQILIIGLLWYIKIYIVFTYQRDHSNDHMAVSIYALRKILVYSIQIPVIKITGIENAFWLESKVQTGPSQGKTHTKREQRFVKKTIVMCIKNPQKIGRVIRRFRSFMDLYCNILDEIISKLCCEQLQWKTVYGSEDAAITGIGTGFFWTLKGLMIARLKKHVMLAQDPIISVCPIFGQNSLKVDFQCIFSIRLGNVINAMRVFYKVKG
ncbi:MAG: DUF2953 domain-containing protein [Sporomusaceae bacterium]|nr:DUF2953 domain-containing protein [Sporomusaceae bacterium]